MIPAVFNIPVQRDTFGTPAAVILQFLDLSQNLVALPGVQFNLQASYEKFWILKQTADGSMSYNR